MLGDDLGECGVGGDDGGIVDALQQELHRGELPLTDSTRVRAHTGERRDVGVARGVDEDASLYRLRATLGGEDQRAHGTVVDDRVGDDGVEQEIEIRLGLDEVVEEALRGPPLIDEHGGTSLEGDGPHPGAARRERGRDFAGYAADSRLEARRFLCAAVRVEAADRAHDRSGEVAAEEPLALAEHDPCTGACRGQRGSEPRRTATGDDHVGLGDHLCVALGNPHHLTLPVPRVPPTPSLAG